jgi:hypothetical protein
VEDLEEVSGLIQTLLQEVVLLQPMEEIVLELVLLLEVEGEVELLCITLPKI